MKIIDNGIKSKTEEERRRERERLERVREQREEELEDSLDSDFIDDVRLFFASTF
jgi:hypothetical protein